MGFVKVCGYQVGGMRAAVLVVSFIAKGVPGDIGQAYEGGATECGMESHPRPVWCAYLERSIAMGPDGPRSANRQL